MPISPNTEPEKDDLLSRVPSKSRSYPYQILSATLFRSIHYATHNPFRLT